MTVVTYENDDDVVKTWHKITVLMPIVNL